MSEDKGGSKADTLVKVVLVFFISLLSFSVGTFVGKQVSDSDHRNLALERDYNKGNREVASVEDKEEGEEAPTSKISEKEVENLTEEFVNKEKSREPAEAKSESKAENKSEEKKEEVAEKPSENKSEKPADEEAATEAAPATPAKAHESSGGYKTFVRGKKVAGAAESEPGEEQESLNQVTEKVLEGKAPTDGKPESHKAAPKLPTVATGVVGKYGVQVVSYADEKDAKEYASTVKQKGFSAFYLAAKVKGKTWYRVMVGPYDSLKSAEEAKVQVAKDLNVAGPIVQKIVQ